MIRRHFVAAALAAAVLPLAPAFAQSPIVIKFSHVVAENTPKGKGALKFKELAEKATGGKVKVEVYPNSTLYKDAEEMNALQLGSVQMLAPSLAKFGPLGVREFEVFDLPYLFDNYAELHKVTSGAVGQELMKKLESKGITGLAFWDNGFRHDKRRSSHRHDSAGRRQSRRTNKHRCSKSELRRGSSGRTPSATCQKRSWRTSAGSPWRSWVGWAQVKVSPRLCW